jgi:HAD superfamily hydrolase (TIGR01662 family)
MNDRDRLAELFAGSGALLLDFDGPVCSVFAGYPAPDVASELRKLLCSRGIEVTEGVATRLGPVELLRWTGRQGNPTVTRFIDDALRTAEQHAVQSATPTPHSHAVITAARDAGKPVAIVSNNSAEAISEYLTEQGLSVGAVIGRTHGQPELMKPNPASILRALAELQAQPDTSVFVGDSVTDVQAGLSAKVRVVGYANKPGKDASLTQAGAEMTITNMSEIASCLRR